VTLFAPFPPFRSNHPFETLSNYQVEFQRTSNRAIELSHIFPASEMPFYSRTSNALRIQNRHTKSGRSVDSGQPHPIEREATRGRGETIQLMTSTVANSLRNQPTTSYQRVDLDCQRIGWLVVSKKSLWQTTSVAYFISYLLAPSPKV
jgi:hypothetical protein